MPDKKIIKNPYYTEGNDLPEYVSEDILNEPGLEAPLVDPISLGVNAATLGAAAIPTTMAGAAKGAMADQIKQAALARLQRMREAGLNPAKEQASQIGQNSMYYKGMPTQQFNADLLQKLRDLKRSQ